MKNEIALIPKIYVFLNVFILLLIEYVLVLSRVHIVCLVLPVLVGAGNLRLYFYFWPYFTQLQSIKKRFRQELSKEHAAVWETSEEIEQWITGLQESLRREDQIQMLRKQAELDALQSQINPHFLYNALECIRGEAMLTDHLEIADMTEALGLFFRYSIDRKKAIVSLADELKNVRDYFLIQHFRFSGRFALDIDYGEDKSVLIYQLPKLTLQPLVENAIYHGLEMNDGKGEVKINISVTDQCLDICVSDNGIGISEAGLIRINKQLTGDFQEEREQATAPQPNRQGAGIALKNVNSRIRIYFGNSYGLHINSTEGLGTQVFLKLPLVLEGSEERVLWGGRVESN